MISAAATRKLAPSATKAASRPKATVKAPPTAAPTASIAPQVLDIMTVASFRSSASTRFGSAACEAGRKKAPSAEMRPWATKAKATGPWTAARKSPADGGLEQRDADHQLAAVEAVGRRAGERAQQEGREHLDHEHRRRGEVGVGPVDDQPEHGHRGEPVPAEGDDLGQEEGPEVAVAAEKRDHARRSAYSGLSWMNSATNQQ